MSKQEFDKADQQVMGVVNGSSEPKPNVPKQTPVPRNRQKLQWLIVQILTCAVLAALFLLAILDPVFAKVISYLGLLVSLIIGAIILDRHFRR